jgi:hypothetical protein
MLRVAAHVLWIQAIDMLGIPWVVMNSSLFTIISLPLYHFEHGRLALAQTFESLRIDEVSLI